MWERDTQPSLWVSSAPDFRLVRYPVLLSNLHLQWSDPDLPNSRLVKSKNYKVISDQLWNHAQYDLIQTDTDTEVLSSGMSW